MAFFLLVEILLKNGFVQSLVDLGNTESDAAREQVARVLLAMVMEVKNRGTVIQDGGAKTLLPLAREGTEKGAVTFRLCSHVRGRKLK